ncbi:5' nucleotidase, deoxy (Pyrimidine), type C protein (NT5C) [Candidatus Electrothrix aarhusensis]|uniref:5' nucleotidase, deoxy (Pyrimidine), type C protein (NT5C) n=1 Tax=Candidatus Electrothrix aarhusensis TaxID=1859131 RepID=A0A3S3R8Y5_9BACT|nr:5' nucleotidase, deoxy (Pyrimidine), type C protein (NT5C) [Candidatus Electrothrix aarhusensis]
MNALKNIVNCPVKINPALLGFDFDGVIADTAEIFLRLACEDYGLCDLRREDIVNFEVEQCLPLDRTQADAIFTKVLLDSVGTGLQPMEGVVDVLGELAELSTISVITARTLAAPVHDWFDAFFPASTCKAIKVTAMGIHDASHSISMSKVYNSLSMIELKPVFS